MLADRGQSERTGSLVSEEHSAFGRGGRSGKWRDDLPTTWETQLRLLLYLKPILLPPMTLPLAVIDTSRNDAESTDTPRAQAASRHIRLKRPPLPPPEPSLFRNPTKLQPHPFVAEKYLTPLMKRFAAEVQRARVTLDNRGAAGQLFPAALLAPDTFDRGGPLLYPYRRPEDLISHVEGVVAEHLRNARTQRPARSTTPELAAIPLSRVLNKELAQLAPELVDVPQIYGTFRIAGEAFLEMVAFYRTLETRQQELQALVRREKQSLRSHLAYWRPRLRPESYLALDAEVHEIFTSLDVLRGPVVEDVKAYRRQLGIHRRGTPIGKHGFWTPLITWTVKALRHDDVTEARACRTVAAVFNKTWTARPAWTADTVKTRRYYAR